MTGTSYTNTALAMSFDKTYPLTPAQEASFAADGFLILSDVLNPAEVTDLQAWAREVHAWPSRKGEHMPYTEVRADGSVGLCRTESESSHMSSAARQARQLGMLTPRLCQLPLWLQRPLPRRTTHRYPIQAHGGACRAVQREDQLQGAWGQWWLRRAHRRCVGSG